MIVRARAELVERLVDLLRGDRFLVGGKRGGVDRARRSCAR
jgi:hypothetical protein